MSKDGLNKYFCKIIVTVLLIILSFLMILSLINSSLTILYIFLTVIIVLILLVYIFISRYLDIFRKCLSENALEITAYFIMILFIMLFFFNIFPPQQIVVEPQKFVEKIPAGDSLVKSFSIRYIDGTDKTLSINIDDTIKDWINVAHSDITNSEKARIIDFSITIPPHTPSGEYRGSIIINTAQTNKTIAAIPVLLIVQPGAQFQASIGDIPGKVNISDWFKVKINIKNTGDSPVYGIRIRQDKSNNIGLDLPEIEDGKIIDLPSKGAEFSTELWVKANATDWQTMQFDISSNNAGNQTLIAKINVVG